MASDPTQAAFLRFQTGAATRDDLELLGLTSWQGVAHGIATDQRPAPSGQVWGTRIDALAPAPAVGTPGPLSQLISLNFDEPRCLTLDWELPFPSPAGRVRFQWRVGLGFGNAVVSKLYDELPRIVEAQSVQVQAQRVDVGTAIPDTHVAAWATPGQSARPALTLINFEEATVPVGGSVIVGLPPADATHATVAIADEALFATTAILYAQTVGATRYFSRAADGIDNALIVHSAILWAVTFSPAPAAPTKVLVKYLR